MNTLVRKSNIALEGVHDSFKASGATLVGVARATPTEIRPLIEPLLEHKCSNKGSGATVVAVNKGYPNKH